MSGPVPEKTIRAEQLRIGDHVRHHEHVLAVEYVKPLEHDRVLVAYERGARTYARSEPVRVAGWAAR
jgi:hypothetical protein